MGFFVGVALPKFKLEVERVEKHIWLKFLQPRQPTASSFEPQRGLGLLVTGSSSLSAPTNSTPLIRGSKFKVGSFILLG